MKKNYQMPEIEILDLGLESSVMQMTSDWDPTAPLIIEPTTPTDPVNPPTPV